jgi:hypothetical protein
MARTNSVHEGSFGMIGKRACDNWQLAGILQVAAAAVLWLLVGPARCFFTL